MKIVIIEDEKPAAEKLRRDLSSISVDLEVIKVIHDVQSSIKWLKANPCPDLIFMDIELTDGLSFEIFDKVTISCPVIFITAYDEYWQNAFKFNGIDYLLKPVVKRDLEKALDKFDDLKKYFLERMEGLVKSMKISEGQLWKNNFLIKRGSEFINLTTDEIAYFKASEKLVFLVTLDNHKYIVDTSLRQLIDELNPSDFMRVNRKYILSRKSVEKITMWTKGRLKIEVAPSVNEHIIIANENNSKFKEWISNEMPENSKFKF